VVLKVVELAVHGGGWLDLDCGLYVSLESGGRTMKRRLLFSGCIC
jgi:hypothetical protein